MSGGCCHLRTCTSRSEKERASKVVFHLVPRISDLEGLYFVIHLELLSWNLRSLVHQAGSPPALEGTFETMRVGG